MKGRPLRIALPDDSSVSARLHHPAKGAKTGAGVVLAHGAGTDMDYPQIVAFAAALAARGHAVLRFNFPYKEDGRKAPDSMAKLQRAFRAAIQALRKRYPERIVIGGRSMGGRVASMLAAEGEPCDGLVLLAYPLHPPRRPEKMRDEHLGAIKAPMLFIQGTRDPLCDLALLRPVLARLGGRAALHEIEGGDHSFDVPKTARKSEESIHAEIVGAIDTWLRGLDGGVRIHR